MYNHLKVNNMQNKLQLLFVLLLGAVLAKAQYVGTGTNIINCSDMPAASVRTDMVSVKYIETGSILKGQVVRHKSNGAIGSNANVNAKVSSKFEVASSDIISGTMTWDKAMGYDNGVNSNIEANPTSWTGTGCAFYYQGAESEKGTWRVPTQGELMLIYILKSKLSGNFLSSYYWSASEYNGINSWCVLFSSGITGTSPKTNTYRVRCVRDL